MHNDSFGIKHIKAVTEFVSEPRFTDETLPESFRQAAEDWLDAPQGLMHWWSPQAATLRAAVSWWMEEAAQRVSASAPLLFSDGDFFPLLQKLNELLAAAQLGGAEAQAHAGQFWVVEHADRLSPEHLDILRRICLHYPELGIHLALFSQAEQAPAAADGVRVVGLRTDVAAPQWVPHDFPGPSASAADAPSRRWLWGGLLFVLVAAGVWQLNRPAPNAPSDAALTGASAQAPAVSESAPAPVPAPAVAVSQALSSSEPAAAPPVQPLLKTQTAKAAEPVSASRRWVLSLPANTWLVVHKQSLQVRELESFKANHTALANARIVLTVAQQGEPARYLLVTAPFRSTERAQNYLQRLEWKASARSTSREELLAQIPN